MNHGKSEKRLKFVDVDVHNADFDLVDDMVVASGHEVAHYGSSSRFSLPPCGLSC